MTPCGLYTSAITSLLYSPICPYLEVSATMFNITYSLNIVKNLTTELDILDSIQWGYSIFIYFSNALSIHFFQKKTTCTLGFRISGGGKDNVNCASLQKSVDQQKKLIFYGSSTNLNIYTKCIAHSKKYPDKEEAGSYLFLYV